MKICPRCKIEKHRSEFARHSTRKDGLQTYCKECNATYDKVRYKTYWKDQVKAGNGRERDKRRQFIWDYLAANPCVDCGETNPIVLQFDHQRDKKADISRIVGSWAWLRVLDEIKKCVIRCANCHLIKTANDLNWYKDQR